MKIGLWLYLLLPPLGWLVVAGLPQGPERFGLQWQVLGFGISCALLSILLDGVSFGPYCDWLRRRNVLPLLVLGLIWLGVMGLVHGFLGPQLEGLLSGLLFLMLFPMACFAWTKVGRDCKVVFAGLVCLLLLVENFCLSFYLWRGFEFSVEVLDGDWFPRVFLNIRDANTIALGASVVAFSLLISKRKSWLGFFLLAAVFFNGWITAGRGLFVSVWFAIFLVALRFAGVPQMRRRSADVVVWGFGALGCSWLIYYSLALAAGGDQLVLQSMIDRLASDTQFDNYGRLFVWREWLIGGLQHDAMFGSGLGVRPVALSGLVFTPHNIFVQLLSEGGVFSVMCVGASMALLCRFNGVVQGFSTPRGVYGLGALLVWCNISAIIFWPVGVWLVSNIAAIRFEPLSPSVFVKEDETGAGRIVFAAALLPLLAVLIAKKLQIWY